MRTSTRTTTIILGALATGALALSAGVTSTSGGAAATQELPESAQSTSLSGTTVLDFPFEGGHQQIIDRGRKGEGPGDLILSTDQPVLDHRTGHRIGVSDAVELIVSARHDGTVDSRSTMRLPGGSIELEGVVRHSDTPFRVPVTSGTGRYAGVRGQLTLLREDSRDKVVVMRLELIR